MMRSYSGKYRVITLKSKLRKMLVLGSRSSRKSKDFFHKLRSIDFAACEFLCVGSLHFHFVHGGGFVGNGGLNVTSSIGVTFISLYFILKLHDMSQFTVNRWR